MKTDKAIGVAALLDHFKALKTETQKATVAEQQSLDSVVTDLRPELPADQAEALALGLRKKVEEAPDRSLAAVGNLNAARIEDLLKE